MSHHDLAELFFLRPSSFRQNFFLLGFWISAENILKIYLWSDTSWITAAACEGSTVDENIFNNPKVAAALQPVVSH